MAVIFQNRPTFFMQINNILKFNSSYCNIYSLSTHHRGIDPKRRKRVFYLNNSGGEQVDNFRDDEEFARIGAKDIWHPYNLQSLKERDFKKVVGKILKREHSLLKILKLREIACQDQLLSRYL